LVQDLEVLQLFDFEMFKEKSIYIFNTLD